VSRVNSVSEKIPAVETFTLPAESRPETSFPGGSRE